MRKQIFRLFCLLLVLFPWGCSPGPKVKTPLVVFAAGSLIQPFNDLEKAFEARYPSIDVQSEYHGSIQVIRHATELHEPIDVVATADHALIPMLMYQTNDPKTGEPNADWYIRFATNELGLAYSDKSHYGNEIDAKNWYEILQRPDVKVGIADPRFDASGYRAMMVFQLAQGVYNQPTLFFDMFSGAFKYPVMVDDNGAVQTIRIPEIMETKKAAHIVLRGSSIQLIALLESGDLDYAFEYKSVIRQHKLKLVELPPELNLGDPGQASNYGKVLVQLDFQRFASVKPEFKGEQIGYGITIPSGAPHPKEAEQFIAFLLRPEGRKIMEADEHPLLDPVTADGYDHLPKLLKPFCKPGP
jgi:molybdate/tungstate transport system substrate-binding protein